MKSESKTNFLALDLLFSIMSNINVNENNEKLSHFNLLNDNTYDSYMSHNVERYYDSDKKIFICEYNSSGSHGGDCYGNYSSRYEYEFNININADFVNVMKLLYNDFELTSNSYHNDQDYLELLASTYDFFEADEKHLNHYYGNYDEYIVLNLDVNKFVNYCDEHFQINSDISSFVNLLKNNIKENNRNLDYEELNEKLSLLDNLISSNKKNKVKI